MYGLQRFAGLVWWRTGGMYAATQRKDRNLNIYVAFCNGFLTHFFCAFVVKQKCRVLFLLLYIY